MNWKAYSRCAGISLMLATIAEKERLEDSPVLFAFWMVGCILLMASAFFENYHDNSNRN
jgi:hypothetical protein